MNIQSLMKEIEKATDHLGAVSSDLKDVAEGEISLDEVNTAYLDAAMRNLSSVQASIQSALRIEAAE